MLGKNEKYLNTIMMIKSYYSLLLRYSGTVRDDTVAQESLKHLRLRALG